MEIAVSEKDGFIALLGFDKKGKAIVTKQAVVSLEDYLLRFQTTWMQRLCARIISKVYIAMCKAHGYNAVFRYYLFWDGCCKRFAVSRKYGYAGYLKCDYCYQRNCFGAGCYTSKDQSTVKRMPYHFKIFYRSEPIV